eukprot:NODE_605_length_5450_cov_0.733695.p2 type:complete len:303 gc:universal NODE_605_length_5450_cov_0.733695:703-1611(+)
MDDYLLKDKPVNRFSFKRQKYWYWMMRHKCHVFAILFVIWYAWLALNTRLSVPNRNSRSNADITEFSFYPPQSVFMPFLEKPTNQQKKIMGQMPSNHQLSKFDGLNCENLIKRHYPKLYKVYINFNEEMRKDTCQYAVIYHFGGTYTDTDWIKQSPSGFIIKKPNRIFAHKSIRMVIGLETKYPGYEQPQFLDPYQVASWAFSAYRKHKFLNYILMDIINNAPYFDYDNHSSQNSTGSGAMTRAMKQYLKDHGATNDDLQQVPIQVGDLYIGDPLLFNCYGYCDDKDCNDLCPANEVVHHFF